MQRAVKADPNNGETWALLAHTYLQADDVQNAYTAYQHALFHLPNPKDPQVCVCVCVCVCARARA